jgi:hypothetical protein
MVGGQHGAVDVQDQQLDRAVHAQCTVAPRMMLSLSAVLRVKV